MVMARGHQRRTVQPHPVGKTSIFTRSAAVLSSLQRVGSRLGASDSAKRVSFYRSQLWFWRWIRCLLGLRYVVRTWLWPYKQRNWPSSSWAPWDSGSSFMDSSRVRMAATPGELVGFIWGNHSFTCSFHCVPVAAALVPSPWPFSPVAIKGRNNTEEASSLQAASQSSFWDFAFTRLHFSHAP